MTPIPAPAAPAVLVIDDDAGVRLISKMILQREGFAVTEAADAATALRRIGAATWPFALILLDLTLPDGSGADLLPPLRQAAPDSPVLVISGGHEDDIRQIGADGFLSKPFVRATLVKAVRDVLGNRG